MLRVRTVFSGMTGAPWVSTMFFGNLIAGAQDCVDAVGAFWGAVDGVMDSEVDWSTQGDVEVVDPVTGNVTAVASTTPATGTGALAVEALPIASQMLVRWRTGLYIGGREVRGRTFIPGITETGNDNGKPASGTITVVSNAANTLRSSALADLNIWSRAHGQNVAVVAHSVWDQFAVLRSRRD